MLVLDREAAVDAWRRAEARIYPSVMVNAELYQQYIGVVRAVADELRDVRTEDDLVTAWHERRDLVREVVSRSAPPMLAIMDLGAVRDAAFCHRHRDLTREQGKVLAAQRLERARIEGAEWVVLFEDVTPLGSHRLEMHVASGRALHAAAELPLDGDAAEVHARGRPAGPDRRRLAAGPAAGDAGADLRHPRGMGRAHRARARPVREALTWPLIPRRSSTRTATSARSRPGSSTTSSTRSSRRSTTTPTPSSSSSATWTTSRSSGRWRSPTTACRSTSCRST